jgi:hypothetical protein
LLFHGLGTGLVLATIDDAGYELAVEDDMVELCHGQWAARCPSPAAALALASTVHLECGVLPSDRSVRRAIAILVARVRRAEAA